MKRIERPNFVNFGEVTSNERVMSWMVDTLAKYIQDHNLEFDSIVQPHIVTLDINTYTVRDVFGLALRLGKIFNVPHAVLYKKGISLTHDLLEMKECNFTGEVGNHALVVDGGFDTANTIVGSINYLGELKMPVGVTDALALTSVLEGRELMKVKESVKKYGVTLHNVMSAREFVSSCHGILQA